MGFSIAGETFGPDEVPYYGVNFFSSIIGLALMVSGVWMRTKSKSLKQTAQHTI
jgi:hypothetical protein